MINEKTSFEKELKNIPIINRHPSPEEELKLQKQWGIYVINRRGRTTIRTGTH